MLFLLKSYGHTRYNRQTTHPLSSSHYTSQDLFQYSTHYQLLYNGPLGLAYRSLACIIQLAKRLSGSATSYEPGLIIAARRFGSYCA